MVIVVIDIKLSYARQRVEVVLQQVAHLQQDVAGGGVLHLQLNVGRANRIVGMGHQQEQVFLCESGQGDG